MSISIRPATPSDAPALGTVHVSSWRVAYAHLLPQVTLNNLSVEDRINRWKEILARAAEGTIVAEIEGTVVGFASIGPGRDPDALPGETSELYALYIDPEYLNNRVGWELWNRARQSLVSQNYKEIAVWVLEGNLRGRTFYERVGFAIDSDARKTINFLGAELPEVRYRIRLT